MKIIIGIDMGTSTTKMVAYTIEQKLIGTMQFEVEDNIENQVGVFISKYNVEKDNIIKIVLTGVRASYVEGEILNKPTVKIDEFTAIGKGVLNAVKKEKALIISMGTGTAYVRVEGGKIEHIGGTGLGGGTLLNLCNKLTGTKNFEEIVDLAKDGNVENINYLLERLRLIEEGEPDEGGIRQDLMEAEKLRLQIINNYVKYLGHTYESLTLKKIQIIVDQLRFKLYTIRDFEIVHFIFISSSSSKFGGNCNKYLISLGSCPSLIRYS